MVGWLPDELSLSSSGRVEDDYRELYNVFRRDFVENEVLFGEEKVFYQETIDSMAPGGDYPAGFTHLITRKNGGQRIIDYRRAVRLPWVRAIIENSDDPAVFVMHKTRSKPRLGVVHDTYLWLEEEDFLVILSRLNRGRRVGQLLVTAFTITEEYQREELKRMRAMG